MRAIIQDQYGATDVLRLEDVDKPVPEDHEVLVRVHAAGLDAGVWHVMTGLPYMIRLMGYGLRRPKRRVCGNDFAGQVEAVGTAVTKVQVGDEVFGAANGSFAEFVCAKEDNCVPKPANLSFEQAAVVPISALTALQGLRDIGRIKTEAAGKKVLVIGAGGGVGTFAVQLAKTFGAEVTGVCSTAKVELVHSIGADHVIDYTTNDFAGPTRSRHSDQRDRHSEYDIILDTAGNRSLTRLRRALAPKGTLVIIGGENGGRWLGGTDRLLRALLLSPLVGQRLRGFVSRVRGDDLQFLAQLLEAGKITPVIDRTFPLSEVPAAVRHFEQGHAAGKVVIAV